MGHQMKGSFGGHQGLPRFAQRVLGLLRCHAMNSNVILGVLDQTQALSVLSTLMTSTKPWGEVTSVPTLPLVQ